MAVNGVRGRFLFLVSKKFYRKRISDFFYIKKKKVLANFLLVVLMWLNFVYKLR
jgi:hypothetical protein